MGRGGGGRARAIGAALLLACAWWLGPAGVVARAAPAAQSGPRVPILAYHAVDASYSGYSVTPEQLAAQCAWLVANGYQAITLEQFWLAALGGAALPPKPVVLTNDDGWPSALLFAEILTQHGLTATYFLNNTSPLTPEQIGTLAAYGAVEAHTVSHANLAGMGYEAQLAEIAENKAYLEGITGRPVRFLAWPFGASDAGAAQAAGAAGIAGAFGLGGTAAVTGAVDPYGVPRLMVESGTTLETFAAMVTGW